MAYSSPWFYLLLTLITLSISSVSSSLSIQYPQCNIFQGRWVHDHSSPPYNSSSCPFIRSQFNCGANGRPDSSYLQYRWQPDDCNLPRFDAEDFLRRFRGKRILFVGDSLMLNQWQSLTCLIHSSFPQAKYTLAQRSPVYSFRLLDYDISIMMQWHQFLVEIETEIGGRALRLDDVKGDEWRDVDLLVFDSYHWWYYKKPTQPWDYMELQGRRYHRLDRTMAFKLAMESWKRWVDDNIDRSKTRVFYQGISPSHYNGAVWGQPHVRGCDQSRLPLEGDGFGLPESPAVAMVKSVIERMKNPAEFLDISRLSLLRPDAHPQTYGGPPGPPLAPGAHRMDDCTHWCLPGLPDTWNQLLYTALL